MKNAFDKFNGIKPITDADLLPPTYAQVAHNLKLDSGKITPCLESAVEATLPDANRNSIYRYKFDGLSLTCGLSGTLADLQSVTNGSFKIQLDTTTYTVIAVNLSGCANKVEMAAVLQQALREQTHGVELVFYDVITDKFKIATSQASIGYLQDGETSDGATDVTATHNEAKGFTYTEAGGHDNYTSGYGKITGWNKTSYPTIYLSYASAGTLLSIKDGSSNTLATVTVGASTGEKTVTASGGSGFGGKINVDVIPTDGHTWNVTATLAETTSASTEYTTYYSWKALDDAFSDLGWFGNLNTQPSWWQVKFERKYVLSGFRIKNGSASYSSYTLKDYNIQGSNDGTTWTTLGTYQNLVTTADAWLTANTIATANRDAYTYYRINITSHHGVGNYYNHIWELEMFHEPVNLASSTYLTGKLADGADNTQPYRVNEWLSWTSADIDVVHSLSDEDTYERRYWTGDSNYPDKLVVYGNLPNAPNTRIVGMPAPVSAGTATATNVIGTNSATYMSGATCSCAVTGAITATVACPLKSFEKTPTGYAYVFRFPETIATGTIDTDTVITPTITFPSATGYAIGPKTTSDIGNATPSITKGGVQLGTFQLMSITDDGKINAVTRTSSTSITNYGHIEYYNHQNPDADTDTIAVQNGTANVSTPTFVTTYTISPFNITVNVNMNWLMEGAGYFYYMMAWVNDMGEIGPLSPISALYKKDSDQVMELTAIPSNFTIAFTDSGDLCTLANHGFPNGVPLVFSSITSTTGITTSTTYYVINSTTNTFQLSATVGGSALPLTTNGLGVATSVFYTKKYIYRSATGANTAGFRFLCELALATTTYTDCKRDSDLGEAMPVRENPPEGLRGLCTHPGNFGVGFVGRQVWVSEVGLMHSWPSKYMLTTDDDIVGLSVNGNDIHVVTNGYPEVITGNSPDALYKAKMLSAYPCVSKRSIKRWGSLTAFISIDGMVVLQGGNGKNYTYDASNRNASIYNPAQWKALHPENAICEVYGDKYYMFINYGGDNTCIIFDRENVVTNDEVAKGTFVDLSEGEMYLIDGSNIMKFERGETYKTWTWRSKEFHDMKPWSPAWFRIIPNESTLVATMKQYAEGVLVSTTNVTAQGAYRFPITRIERKHFYEIVSAQPIDWFAVSENSKELQR